MRPSHQEGAPASACGRTGRAARDLGRRRRILRTTPRSAGSEGYACASASPMPREAPTMSTAVGGLSEQSQVAAPHM
eukprot:5014424-Prymnesium_polylepis.2